MVEDMNLVIDEPPTKARTLTKFLGEGYAVEATMGHVRDLPEKKMGIKIADGKFTPEYMQTERQKTNMAKIQSISGSVDRIYLATDPDREGEAIAWHTAMLLNPKFETLNPKQIKNVNDQKIKRIVFHEI